MLIEAYNPAVYNGLGEVELVDKLVTEADILDLGKIILKFGHENGVTVIKAHRHFDLAAIEAMLETEDVDNGSIARPAALDEILADGKAKPNVVVFDPKANSWFPVNFALMDSDVPAFADQAFLQSCADYLVENGLADKLMLGVRRGNNEAKDEQMMYLETNWIDTRTSEMKALSDGAMPANTIGTTFVFKWEPNGEGVMIPAQACMTRCTRTSNGGHAHSHYQSGR